MRDVLAMRRVAAGVEQEIARLEALKTQKTPQSGWALLNPLTSAKMIAGHYDNIETVHREEVEGLEQLRHGAVIAGKLMERHGYTIDDLRAMDVKELAAHAGMQNALAVKGLFSSSAKWSGEASHLITETDVIAKFIGEQVRDARAYDESLKKSASMVKCGIGHASAAVLDAVSETNGAINGSLETAREYYDDPSRKDSIGAKLGRAGTFGGEALASTVTMPLTVADHQVSDETRSNAVAGTALLLGTMGLMKGGAPAAASVRRGVFEGTKRAAATGIGRAVLSSGPAKTIAGAAEALGRAELAFETSAVARNADKVKAVLRKVNAGVELAPSSGLGRPVRVEDALIQKLPGWEKRSNLVYGMHMGDVARKIEARIADGRIKTASDALDFTGGWVNRTSRRMNRADVAAGGKLDEFGMPRIDTREGRFEAVTGTGGPYSGYQQRARDFAEANGGIRTAVEDGIPLTSVTPGRWFHTSPRDFARIQPKLDEAFERALTAKSKGEVIDAVAELHWWGAHMMPYARGSAGGMDAIAKALLNHRGVSTGVWKNGVAVDLEAFHMSKGEFVAAYRKLFE
jgi:hypothetical protein